MQLEVEYFYAVEYFLVFIIYFSLIGGGMSSRIWMFISL